MLILVDPRVQAFEKRKGCDATAPAEETVIDRLHRRLNTINNMMFKKAEAKHQEFGVIYEAQHRQPKKRRRKATDPNEFEKWQHEQIVERLKYESTIRRL